MRSLAPKGRAPLSHSLSNPDLRLRTKLQGFLLPTSTAVLGSMLMRIFYRTNSSVKCAHTVSTLYCRPRLHNPVQGMGGSGSALGFEHWHLMQVNTSTLTTKEQVPSGSQKHAHPKLMQYCFALQVAVLRSFHKPACQWLD